MQAVHRISHDRSSILSVAVSQQYIFAGTQSHIIAVHDLKSFAHVVDLKGHNGSILSLVLSPDETKLFSSSGDSIVKVWCTKTFKCLHVIYSCYDVGDVFSLAYSPRNDTLYLGSQNTSLQWINLSLEQPVPNKDSYPTRRPNKFFDSTGPSGRSAMPTGPISTKDRRGSTGGDVDSRILLEINKDNIVQYAHYSYVFCLFLGQVDEEEVLFTGGGDGAINIWSTGDRPRQIRSLCQSEGASVLSLAQHESLLYAGHSRGCLSIWDLETNQLLRRVQAHEADIQSLTVSKRCLITVGGTDMKVWSLSTGVELIESTFAHEGLALCATAGIARQDGLLITGGNDNDVAVWNITGAEETLESSTILGNSAMTNGDADAFMPALKKLVSFRSISGSDAHVEDCRRAATYLKSLASQLGADASLIPTEHNPIVMIKFKANMRPSNASARESKSATPARSILYYGHYDVISANEHAWSHSPWNLTGHNGYLYGRGVSDNKAPILAALFAAHELLTEQALAVDLTLLIEGEEESGSRGFRKAISHYNKLGKIDKFDEVFLSNSYWLNDHVPCLTYGLRGAIRATITISNNTTDLHSGVEGGSMREPTIDLVNLLGKLTDDTGAIAIPDFYEPVRTVGENERKFYEEIARSQLQQPDSLTPRTKTRHTSAILDQCGASTTERQEILVEDLMNRWCRPSLTIHLMSVSGSGSCTVIPHLASAFISMRIVPDQELAKITEQFVVFMQSKFATFKSPNTLEIKIENISDWWLSSPTSASFTRLSMLIEQEWGMQPLIIREGGSIPMVRWLEQEFGATAIHFPMGQSSDSAHLVDERLRILNIDKGRAIMKKYFAL